MQKSRQVGEITNNVENTAKDVKDKNRNLKN